jgi:hypothetical protein
MAETPSARISNVHPAGEDLPGETANSLAETSSSGGFLYPGWNVNDIARSLIYITQGLIFVIRILICAFDKIRVFCAPQHKFAPSKSRRLPPRAQSLGPQIPVFAGLFRSSTVSTAIPTTSRGRDTMVNKLLTESHETKSIGPHVAAAAEPFVYEVGSITKR